jgi:large subunit ribosomal protein L27
MAHKKGTGSSRNGRDSSPQYRGLKRFGGETVTCGTIIVRQLGTKYKAGQNTKIAKDFSLFATADGTVRYGAGRRIHVDPIAAN